MVVVMLKRIWEVEGVKQLNRIGGDGHDGNAVILQLSLQIEIWSSISRELCRRCKSERLMMQSSRTVPSVVHFCKMIKLDLEGSRSLRVYSIEQMNVYKAVPIQKETNNVANKLIAA